MDETGDITSLMILLDFGSTIDNTSFCFEMLLNPSSALLKLSFNMYCDPTLSFRSFHFIFIITVFKKNISLLSKNRANDSLRLWSHMPHWTQQAFWINRQKVGLICGKPLKICIQIVLNFWPQLGLESQWLSESSCDWIWIYNHFYLSH